MLPSISHIAESKLYLLLSSPSLRFFQDLSTPYSLVSLASQGFRRYYRYMYVRGSLVRRGLYHSRIGRSTPSDQSRDWFNPRAGSRVAHGFIRSSASLCTFDACKWMHVGAFWGSNGWSNSINASSPATEYLAFSHDPRRSVANDLEARADTIPAPGNLVSTAAIKLDHLADPH
jgi:hypothetical protein